MYIFWWCEGLVKASCEVNSLYALLRHLKCRGSRKVWFHKCKLIWLQRPSNAWVEGRDSIWEDFICYSKARFPEGGQAYCHMLSSVWCNFLYLQADVVLVDRDGGEHPVYGFLLVAKFPLFRSLPEENFKLVTIADMSKGVMALLVDLAYGLDRFSHLLCCARQI